MRSSKRSPMQSHSRPLVRTAETTGGGTACAPVSEPVGTIETRQFPPLGTGTGRGAARFAAASFHETSDTAADKSADERFSGDSRGGHGDSRGSHGDSRGSHGERFSGDSRGSYGESRGRFGAFSTGSGTRGGGRPGRGAR
jgi:hypothetical protein